MVTQSAHSRPSPGFSPALVLALIVMALGVIEGLLVARFSIQLFAATASEGLGALVLDISRPLVAPFSTETISQESIGRVDRGTLLAAAVYLTGALCLIVVTTIAGGLLAGRNVLANRRRRASIGRHRQATRLVGTASLSLSPTQATRTLRLLKMGRLNAELFVIPAEGGCIVAGFTDAPPAGGLPWFGGIRKNRDVDAVRKALRDLEDRFQDPDARKPAPESAPRLQVAPSQRTAAANR